MRLTRVEIGNFRSIRHLVLDLGETTVFIGPNNAGKTAVIVDVSNDAGFQSCHDEKAEPPLGAA